MPFVGFMILVACNGAQRPVAPNPRRLSDPSALSTEGGPIRPSTQAAPEPWGLGGDDSLGAYQYLLAEPALRLGDRCGISGEVTELWKALSQLVAADDAAMLRDLSVRASTLEARAAAIVGLTKLRRLSNVEARGSLTALQGTLTVCDGCSALPCEFENPIAMASPFERTAGAVCRALKELASSRCPPEAASAAETLRDALTDSLQLQLPVIVDW